MTHTRETMRRIGTLLGALSLMACGTDAPLELPVAIGTGTPPFTYPEALWDEGVEGQVVVMVHVTERGAVDSVYVRSTSGYEEMDTSAVRGARELRFQPGRRGEEPVEVWVRLPVRFTKTPPAAGADGEATPGSSVGTGTRG